MLIERKRPVMLVGTAGTGKTVLMQGKLSDLSDEYMVTNVPFNFYTTSLMLQGILEKPLEKKAGRNYGPPGTRRLVYFVDDMNMPEVTIYLGVQCNLSLETTHFWKTQTCIPLQFWRKAHNFLGYLTPLRLLSISLRFSKFAVFPESFQFQFIISLPFRIL